MATALETRLANAVMRSWHTHDGYGNGFCIHCETSDGDPHKEGCVALVAEEVLGWDRLRKRELRDDARLNKDIGSW